MKYAPFDELQLTMKPIGVIRTSMQTKFQSPHQPSGAPHEESIIHLISGQQLHVAVQDLASFDRIWLIWWFHRNESWRPLVLPPRGEAKRRGVFATRSPHRPNPIGITCVPLLGVDGLTIRIGSSDLVDGTPILDIKPYIAEVDAFPEASSGWLHEVDEYLAIPPKYQIAFSPLAEEQLGWLRTEWNIDFLPRVTEVLTRDPRPHRTRRIKRVDQDTFHMGCGPWRVVFTLNENVVMIKEITSGYSRYLLYKDKSEWVPDQDAQVAFNARWPEGIDLTPGQQG
jgi:tRNA-Thr(GGU) m(6)t(6)A37 methyltransferase TsaA